MRLAFIGFRHGHIFSFYDHLLKDKRVSITAACEDDASTASKIRAEGKVRLTHESHSALLDNAECDAVAIGDVYGNRGQLVIEALRRGKHVIIDKPICTRLSELQEIERLCAAGQLHISALLDTRGSGSARTARRLIAENAIGDVQTVNFSAQHPLLLGKRPEWYFVPGMQGGTINDIGIHAFDSIPWMTGRRIVESVAARAWNARLPEFPHFQDGAQIMLRLDNGGGVLGDLSYLAPDALGYSVPQYWRMTFHGAGGVIEFNSKSQAVTLVRSKDKEPQEIALESADHFIAWESFLRETGFVKEPLTPLHLTTQQTIRASRLALRIQEAADQNQCHVAL